MSYGQTQEGYLGSLNRYVPLSEFLLNNAEWGIKTANFYCETPPFNEDKEWGPCMYYYYATRDIEAGEELLVNYSEFEEKSQVGWVEFLCGCDNKIEEKSFEMQQFKTATS